MRDMHPTDVLMNEHRVIEGKLDELEGCVEQIEGGAFPREVLEGLLDFFRDFADGFHHAKEERLLFPALAARGVPQAGGPIGVMLAEHDEGRAYLAAIRGKLDAAAQGSAEAREAIRGAAQGYAQHLRSHIFKEDNILFRMARMVLGASDVEELNREFASVSERYSGAAPGV